MTPKFIEVTETKLVKTQLKQSNQDILLCIVNTECKRQILGNITININTIVSFKEYEKIYTLIRFVNGDELIVTQPKTLLISMINKEQ